MTDQIVATRTSDQMVALMKIALAQHRLSGLSEMLQSIAGAVGCFGCILWEVMTGSDIELAESEGRLVVLAQWFEGGGKSVVRILPFQSATGHAILRGKPVNVLDIKTDPWAWKEDPFLLRHGIKYICSVPITFEGKTRAALNLYRISQPFSSAEVEQIGQLASFVPGLYETIKDKVSFNIVRSINRFLQRANLEIAGEELVQNAAVSVLKPICDELGSALQCVEASVFLEDPTDRPGIYTLAATTWVGEIPRKEYRKDPEAGLTGWALANSRHVRIFDLLHFDRDAPIIQREYPGITWEDSLKFRSAVGKALGLSPNELPPLSYIASPIVTGGRTLGVITCCTAKQEPYYFGDRELRLLQLAGAQIGQYWSGLLAHRELSRENTSWHRLAESVAMLNSVVLRQLMLERPEEGEIFAEALRPIHSVIPGAEIMDVRLLDEQSRELYFAETYGDAWDIGTPEEIARRKARRFRIDDESVGAHVYRTGKAYEIDYANDPHYSQTFPDARRIVVSPIKVEDKVIGLLDIRATGVSAFPKHATTIAELLGQQLGLYHYLVSAIGRLRVTEAELKTNMVALRCLQEQQAQTFEDLEHQLKSPIVQAYVRIQAALSGDVSSPKHRSNLQAIRGLCARARRVAISTGLFARLARSEPIEPRPDVLRHDDLIKSLVAAAMDNELTVEQSRNISFVVDRSSFNGLTSLEVRADQDLLEQAVGNLLDNAAKYSFENTKVHIYGGLTKTQRFHISVINKGLQIRFAELQHCIERGWRSESAKLTTGEGAGIGLWTVHHIMVAQGGELIIVPTDDQGFTEAKLVFPCRKRY